MLLSKSQVNPLSLFIVQYFYTYYKAIN